MSVFEHGACTCAANTWTGSLRTRATKKNKDELHLQSKKKLEWGVNPERGNILRARTRQHSPSDGLSSWDPQVPVMSGRWPDKNISVAMAGLMVLDWSCSQYFSHRDNVVDVASPVACEFSQGAAVFSTNAFRSSFKLGASFIFTLKWLPEARKLVQTTERGGAVVNYRKSIRRDTGAIPGLVPELGFPMWLDYSPPTMANRVRFPTGSRRRFSHMGIMADDVAGRRVFSGISRFPSIFNSGAAAYSSGFNLIGSQDLDVKSRPNLFTHSYVPTHLSSLLPRNVRGGCPRCGRGGGEDDVGPGRSDDDDGSPPAAVPGSGERASTTAAPAPGASRLPDVVPRRDAAAGEPVPPARRSRPQPPARRARRRWPPPPVPPPRGLRHALAPARKKYWEVIGENLRHIADELRPSPAIYGITLGCHSSSALGSRYQSSPGDKLSGGIAARLASLPAEYKLAPVSASWMADPTGVSSAASKSAVAYKCDSVILTLDTPVSRQLYGEYELRVACVQARRTFKPADSALWRVFVGRLKVTDFIYMTLGVTETINFLYRISTSNIKQRLMGFSLLPTDVWHTNYGDWYLRKSHLWTLVRRLRGLEKSGKELPSDLLRVLSRAGLSGKGRRLHGGRFGGGEVRDCQLPPGPRRAWKCLPCLCQRLSLARCVTGIGEACRGSANNVSFYP
ncbi:hypothetical protein PR048_014718 [Dryococelus australis]|uniref:Uncharacterized protein n=1 Tax=Dryococelus australis TaxID=614101 RepID=A0ABQ9HF77_9NEOP|nr:hypothetical protein PR048_014718 [Dryococelus australis]